MKSNLSAGLLRKEREMETKQDVINQIRLLMKKHAITLKELASPETTSQEKNESENKIKKFFSFLGGIFILSGLSVYISQYWASMNSFARVTVTLGVGVAFFIFAIVAVNDKRYKKVLTPFFVLAALFETSGMFVALREFFPYSSDWHKAGLLVFGTLLIQYVVTFLKYNRTVLLYFSLVFGAAFFGILFDYMNMNSNYSQTTIGFALVLISYGIDDTKHKSITPFWYLVGSSIFLFGIFSLVENTFIEPAFLAISILLIYVSTLVRSRSLLFTGTISLVSYIGYFSNKHFLQSLGWPLFLILFGLLLIAISVMTIRIGKTIK